MKLSTGVLLCLATISATAAETKVKMSSLPPAIQKAIQAELNGSELIGLSKETEKGKTFYEAETKQNGKSRDMLFDGTGAVVEVEQETELSALPASARDAILKKASKGKVTKVESLTKSGKLVGYEATITNGSKTSEIAVTPEGAPYKD